MPEVTASSSMSMPQSEAAPSSPSAASTTPLPEPISSTLAPCTLADLASSTGIGAAVYSPGTKAATASSDRASDTSLGFDTSITPKDHTSRAQSPPMPFEPTATSPMPSPAVLPTSTQPDRQETPPVSRGSGVMPKHSPP